MESGFCGAVMIILESLLYSHFGHYISCLECALE